MVSKPEHGFKQRVHDVVALVPSGRVVTYGQVAAMVGAPRAAQAVGWTAHWGHLAVPWQRVLNRRGRLAPAYPGGFLGHAEDLRAEGVAVREDWTVDLAAYQWFPDPEVLDGFSLDPASLEWLQTHLPYGVRHSG